MCGSLATGAAVWVFTGREAAVDEVSVEAEGTEREEVEEEEDEEADREEDEEDMAIRRK